MGLRPPQLVSTKHALAAGERHRRFASKLRAEWNEPPRSFVIELLTPFRLDFSCQLQFPVFDKRLLTRESKAFTSLGRHPLEA